MEKSEFIEALQVILYRCSRATLGDTHWTPNSAGATELMFLLRLHRPPSRAKGGSAPAFRSPRHPSPGLRPVHPTRAFSETHLSPLHEGVIFTSSFLDQLKCILLKILPRFSAGRAHVSTRYNATACRHVVASDAPRYTVSARPRDACAAAD